MLEAALFILLILVFIALTGGTGQKKAEPPPLPRPTERDKVIEELILTQYGGAIAKLTEQGKASLIKAIKELKA